MSAYGFPDHAAASGFRFRLALASVAPVPLVVDSVQEYLASNPTNPEAFKQAGYLAGEACRPIDDVRGSARYRKAMVRRLTEKALAITWQRVKR